MSNVVLTGASSGIGAALAVLLARRGDRLTLVARRASQLEEVAQEARAKAQAAGRGEVSIRCRAADVTDRATMQTLLAEAEKERGIDLLILNAGIDRAMQVEGWDDQIAARILDVNLTSVTHAIGAVLPGMLARRRGHLVGISSVASYRGLPESAAYCASKAGLSTLLESLRLDLRPCGIKVTVVSPGFVKTPMTENNRHPMPFLVEVEDAARHILRGIERSKREVRFPMPIVCGVRILRALPDWLFDLLTGHYRPPESPPPITGPDAAE